MHLYYSIYILDVSVTRVCLDTALVYFARKYSQSSSYTDDSGNRTEANPASPLGPTSPGHSTYRRAMSSPDTGQFVNNASNIDYRSPALHRRLDVTSSPPSQANVTPSQGHRVSPQGHVTSPRSGNVVLPSGTSSSSSSSRVTQSQPNVQRTSTMQPYSSHTQPHQQTVASPPGALTSTPRHQSHACHNANDSKTDEIWLRADVIRARVHWCIKQQHALMNRAIHAQNLLVQDVAKA